MLNTSPAQSIEDLQSRCDGNGHEQRTWPPQEDADSEMNMLARVALQRAAEHWREIETHIAWCDERIAQHGRDNAQVRQAAQLIGIGPVTASAVVSAVGDFHLFKNGAQFSAWLGLVPRQRSSGGKSVLGGITKHGQNYLRMLLIQGAKSAVMTAERRSDRIAKGVAERATAPAGRRPW